MEVRGDLNVWAMGFEWLMIFATTDEPTCEANKAPKGRRSQVWGFVECGCGVGEKVSRPRVLLTF